MLGRIVDLCVKRYFFSFLSIAGEHVIQNKGGD